MNRQAILTCVACAAGTFLLIFWLAAPTRLNATEPTILPAFLANQLSIMADGVELLLQLEPRPASDQPLVVQPDFKLKFKLVARNTTDRSVEVHPTVSLESRSISSPFSRVLPAPTQLWQHEQPLIVAAGETKTCELAPDVTLAPSSTVQAILTIGQQSIAPVSFSVASPSDGFVAAAR